ncbi:MAG: NUDIX hydrolase [Anaerolineae bacterium]
MVKKRIAAALRRVPVLVEIAVAFYRLTRARFTAGVAAVVVNENAEVLVVEHVYHARLPWGLPGGWLEAGEDPAAAVRRECLEELGLEIAVVRPLVIGQVLFRRHLDIAYLCRPVGEITTLSAELIDYRWAAMDDLPPMMSFHLRAVQAVIGTRVMEQAQ